MGRLTVEQIVSVDGYGADADGGLGFIESARGGNPNDHDQLAFLDGIVVWGSFMLADALFAAGLVDDLRLRVVPVLIGEGRSFTPADLGERRLELDHVATHPSGHLGLSYRVR